MSRSLMALAIIVGLAVLAIFGSVYTVYETQQALVLQFGRYD